jgi:hypothetical protein
MRARSGSARNRKVFAGILGMAAFGAVFAISAAR